MKAIIQYLEAQKAKGRIRDYSDKNPTLKKNNKPNVSKKGNKTKAWIGKNLWAWSIGNKIELKTEFEFHPERKWRFDWCFPSLMIAIEYEGLMSDKSRHTTVTGFTGDAEKYNEAQKLGWRVFRYTALNYKSIIQDLNNNSNK